MKPQFYFLKRIFLFAFLFSFGCISSSSAQQYLTKIDGWNAYVHLPDEYNDSLHKNYPVIIFIPGLGEVGTDPNKLMLYGPARFIRDGHNMQFTVNGTLEKPIVISIQPASAWPHPPTLNRKLDSIMYRFRCDQQRVNVTGLSMGGWSWNNFVDGYNNLYTNRITSIVSLSAPEPDNTYSNMRHFALAGGKIWGFEGNNDLRGMLRIRDTMNKYVPASVRYTQYIGGHCCWNTFYNPGWTENGESIYTWMLKQRKPAPTVPIPPLADAGTDAFTPSVIPSINLNGYAEDPKGLPITFAWAKIDGPAQGNLNSSTSLNPTVSGMTLGTYKFVLSVTNALGLEAKDTVTIYNGESILPVKLTDFSGKKQGQSVLLQWITASELNVDRYAIERSESGSNFSEIGTVISDNINNSTYRFTDLTPIQGVNYYRLKMMDKDGYTEYSKTITVRFHSKFLQSAWLQYVGADNNLLNVHVTSTKAQAVQLTVMDAAGKQIHTQSYSLQSGANQVQLSKYMSKGIYFIKMQNGLENMEPLGFYVK